MHTTCIAVLRNDMIYDSAPDRCFGKGEELPEQFTSNVM